MGDNLNTTLKIRNATTADHGFLKTAFQYCNREMVHDRPEYYQIQDNIVPSLTMFRAFMFAKARGFMANKQMLIAERGEKQLGFAYLKIEKPDASSWVKFKKPAKMETLFVRPDYCDQGIAKALCEAAKEWAKENGCDYFYGEIGPDNSASLTVAEQSGRKLDRVTMGMALSKR